MLGVTPGTLRRWSDSGQVTAFTTLGGHRRYRRVALEGLMPSDRTPRPTLRRAGLTIARVTRAYRQEARDAAATMPWLGGLTESQRAWFRTHGRRLAEHLLVHLDTTDNDAQVESLRQASEGAGDYGRMAAELGLSLSQAVEGFLQFRRPFLHQLTASAANRGLDAAATADLVDRTERAMDRLLMSAMAGHGVGRAAAKFGTTSALGADEQGDS